MGTSTAVRLAPEFHERRAHSGERPISTNDEISGELSNDVVIVHQCDLPSCGDTRHASVEPKLEPGTITV